jgi:predicted PurR-regulated permease PerM
MKNSKNKLILFLELFTLLFSYEYIYKCRLTIYALNPFFASLLIGLFFSYKFKDKLKDLSKSKKVLVVLFTLFMLLLYLFILTISSVVKYYIDYKLDFSVVTPEYLTRYNQT